MHPGLNILGDLPGEPQILEACSHDGRPDLGYGDDRGVVGYLDGLSGQVDSGFIDTVETGKR